MHLFLIDWWLLYNNGLILVIHQHELNRGLHMSPPSRISLPPPAYSHPSSVGIITDYYRELVEKERATHSSIPAWRIPGTEEPGGLPSMGSQRVDWSNLAAACIQAEVSQDYVLTNRTESLPRNFPAIQDVCHLLGPPTFHSVFLERSWGIQYRGVCCGFLCSQFLE